MSEQEQTNRTFGEWAYSAISKHYHKFIKYEEKVLKNKNPEHLHQMRVGMRRLRGAIAFFSPAIDLPHTVTPDRIGKIAKILGELRDIDVLQETLTTKYQPHLPNSEQKSLEIVFKKLDKQRKSAFKAVVKVIDDKDYLKIKKDCQQWLDEPCYQAVARIKIQQILPDLLLPEVSYFLLHPAWSIGLEENDSIIDLSKANKIDLSVNISSNQEKSLHDLRKVAKKMRYNMELFQNLYNEAYSNYLREIEELQEVLGSIQDYAVLKQFLCEILEQDIAEAMPVFNQILEKNHQQQWKQWQIKQKYFLNSVKRQDLRTIVQYPI